MQRYIPFLLFSLLLFVGCDSDDKIAGNQETGSISGHVRFSSSGNPVIGAVVNTSPPTESVTTNSDGAFLISDVAVGNYVVTVTGDKNATASVQVSVKANKTTESDILVQEVDNPNIPKNGLLLHYRMDGTAVDASGNDRDGTVSGASATEDRFGNPNSALRFNGSSSFVSYLPDQALAFESEDDFTVSAWIKFSATQATYAGIVASGPANVTYPGYLLGVKSANKIVTQIGLSSSAEYVEYVGTRGLSDDNWHLVTLVVAPSSNAIKIYVDDAIEINEASTQINCALMGASPLYIGKDRNSTRFFDGSIDDVRIYDRALSTQEIVALYADKN